MEYKESDLALTSRREKEKERAHLKLPSDR